MPVPLLIFVFLPSLSESRRRRLLCHLLRPPQGPSRRLSNGTRATRRRHIVRLHREALLYNEPRVGREGLGRLIIRTTVWMSFGADSA